MKAVLFAAGPLRPGSRWLEHQCRTAGLLIAVDGGLRHALATGVRPQLLLGDLDSVTPEDLEVAAGMETMIFPANKDQTDLELAVTEAVSRGADRLVLAGTLGARHDHGLANLFLAARLHREQGLDICLGGDGTLAWPLMEGDALTLPVPQGSTFSMLALESGCRVSLSGARYDLDAAELPFGHGLGVSNVSGQETLVTVHGGLLLLLVVCADV